MNNKEFLEELLLKIYNEEVVNAEGFRFEFQEGFTLEGQVQHILVSIYKAHSKESE